MNSKWFKEERKLPKSEQGQAIQDAKEVLGHSVLMSEKLKRILTEEIAVTYKDDEDLSGPGWQQRALANIGARKALRKLHDLLP